MEKEIYNANPLEELKNEYFRLQRLEEGGRDMRPEIEEVWDKITDIIHQEDEVKIQGLRERINDIIKEEKHTEIVQKMWEEEKHEP